MKGMIKFFDKVEDRVRAKLSHYPIPYAIIGGFAIVIFWRGVWHLADDLEISSVSSILIGGIVMLATGLFVSFFIGDRIILSGLKQEKKIFEKTESEIVLEANILDVMNERLKTVEKEIRDIKDLLSKRP
jgi:hypothetical protein